jgi:predicted transcriptional regulator
MVARKSTQMQLKCRLGCKYLEVLQELVTSQLLSRRQIGARYEYITTPTGREWLEHYYALVSILHGRKVLVAKNLENVVRSR